MSNKNNCYHVGHKEYSFAFDETEFPRFREERLKVILDDLKQASLKMNASKYLKDWHKNPERDFIFLAYFEKQPKLCLILIEAMNSFLETRYQD